jgi:prevent-host-death family protein
MPKIGAYDAKSKLSELLRQVQRGKRFTITRRGQPVAELVPVAGSNAQIVAEAIAAMRRFERVPGVAAADVADWIAEGRR